MVAAITVSPLALEEIVPLIVNFCCALTVKPVKNKITIRKILLRM